MYLRSSETFIPLQIQPCFHDWTPEPSAKKALRSVGILQIKESVEMQLGQLRFPSNDTY
jgi:hypothetical protein